MSPVVKKRVPNLRISLLEIGFLFNIAANRTSKPKIAKERKTQNIVLSKLFRKVDGWLNQKKESLYIIIS
jgi:hypothetical protein